MSLAELIEARFGLATGAGRERPAEGTLAAMLARRVCRNYAEKPVAEDLMQVLFAAALSAPSKSDLQQASIVRVLDPAKRATIQGWLASMPWIAAAPQLMIFCGDNRRTRRLAMLRGKPFPNDTLDMFMNAAVDAGIVLQAFVTAAESVGLGCCPLSLVRDRARELAGLLELPQHVFPVAGLTVGYPASPGALSMRLPPSITVHVDRYVDGDFESQLEAYDRRREAARPTPRGKQRDAERFGTVERYGWSEDKARQYAVPHRADFGEFIRAQGFALE
ncbi:MAG: nitroreductase family protein [Burkholderiales bacterium]|nr:nitroreductase family protein [Burkholderiales bacterium]